jgi:hypothetical protein
MSWLKTLGKQGDRTELFQYENGAYEVWQEGLLIFVRYGIGDQIWLAYQDGEYRVTKVVTHDGVTLEESGFNSHPYGVSKTS